METANATKERIIPAIQGLPEDVELIGLDGGVTYLRSASRGLVYIAQGTTVWALPTTGARNEQEETPAQ